MQPVTSSTASSGLSGEQTAFRQPCSAGPAAARLPVLRHAHAAAAGARRKQHRIADGPQHLRHSLASRAAVRGLRRPCRQGRLWRRRRWPGNTLVQRVRSLQGRPVQRCMPRRRSQSPAVGCPPGLQGRMEWRCRTGGAAAAHLTPSERSGMSPSCKKSRLVVLWLPCVFVIHSAEFSHTRSPCHLTTWLCAPYRISLMRQQTCSAQVQSAAKSQGQMVLRVSNCR